MNDEWVETTLGDVASLTIGRTPPRKDSRYWTDDLTLPFCTIADMDGPNIDPQREGVTPLAEAEGKAKRVPAGSLLMSFKLTIGRVGIATRDLFPNEAIVWIEPSQADLDLRYLAYWLEAQDLSEGSGRAVKGNTLNSTSLRSIRVVVPPLHVQRRIVDLMGHLVTHLKNLEAERDSLTALMDQMCIEAETSSDLIPLGQLLEGIDAGKSPSGEDRTPGPGERAVLKVSAVSPQGFDASQVKTVGAAVELPASLSVSRGDVLMVRANGVLRRVGQVCQVESDHSRLFLSDKTLRLVSGPSLDSTYLSFILQTPRARRRIEELTTGSDMRNISQRAIRQIEVPTPTMELQLNLAARLKGVRSLVRDLSLERDRLHSLRKAILSALLTRDLEVPESYDELLGLV